MRPGAALLLIEAEALGAVLAGPPLAAFGLGVAAEPAPADLWFG